MAKKTKKSEQSPVSEVPQTPEIPKDLQEKLGAVRALAGCYNQLQCGMFQVVDHANVQKSLQFLQALHQQALMDACQHPQASLVEELKQFIANTKGE